MISDSYSSHPPLTRRGRGTAVVAAGVLLLAALWTAGPGTGTTIGKPDADAARSRESLRTANDLSAAFKTVSREVSPSVVHVSAVKKFRNPLNRNGGGPNGGFEFEFDGDFLRRFFGDRFSLPGPDQDFEQRGVGTGFIISADGYVMTNNHVVRGADEVIVELPNGEEFGAKVVGGDESTDIAVLKIEAVGLTPASFGDSDAIEVGEWVLAIGNPFGLDQTVTAGIVSAKARAGVGIARYEEFIQTDAAINPGNSGGPLVNLRGEVIGVNTAIASRSGGYMGIGFAVPVNVANSVAQSLMKEGRVIRGWLGVAIQDLDNNLARSFGFKGTQGVLVGQVIKDSPADKGGMREGDILLEMEGRKVTTAQQVSSMVARTLPGQKVEFTIWRNEKESRVRITIAERDAEVAAAEGGEGADDLGFSLSELTDEVREAQDEPHLDGVLVTGVRQGSAAWRAGLRDGDVIVRAGGADVKSLNEFREALKRARDEAAEGKAAGIRLQVLSEKSRRFVFLKLGE